MQPVSWIRIMEPCDPAHDPQYVGLVWRVGWTWLCDCCIQHKGSIWGATYSTLLNQPFTLALGHGPNPAHRLA